MSWIDTLKAVAPTVATALGSPMAGVAVSALGSIFGIDAPTQDKIAKVFKAGQLTPEALEKIQTMELEYREHEAQRGVTYVELAFKDRDSARQASVSGGTLNKLFWLSLWLLSTVLGAELCVLALGVPHGVPEIIVGRILGMLDGVALQVMNFWYGTSHGSSEKTALLAASTPVK